MQLLWDGPDRPARGPAPSLSLEAIIEAAIATADSDGLSALTMTRVARELDVTAMATYRYVPGKEELIDLMIDAAFAKPPAERSGDWRADLEYWAREELALLRAHPWLIETVLKRTAVGPNWTAWLEAGFACLESTPLGTSETFSAILLVDSHVRATAQMAGASAEWQENLSRVFATAVADPRYRVLGRALQVSAASDAEQMAVQFEFGLACIFDGIQVFIDAHRSSST